MLLASQERNQFKEPNAKPPASLEQYRSAITKTLKYKSIQIRRELGEQIPEAEDEDDALEYRIRGSGPLQILWRTPGASGPFVDSYLLGNTITSIEVQNPANGKYTRIEVKLYSQRPSDRCREWLEVLHVFCTHLGKRVAYAMAFYVDREMIRPRFMEEMFAATGILRDIGMWTFDRYGRLRQEHKYSPNNSQVEDWGSLLDEGAFVILHSFWVAEEWRRKGLARRMIDTIVNKVQAIKTPALSMLAVPGALIPAVFESPVSRNAITRPYSLYDYGSNAKLLLWSMGFLRIGCTPCFATRIDPASNQYCFNRTIYEDSEEEVLISASNLVPNERKWVHGLASRIGLPFGDWQDQLHWFKLEKQQFPVLYATATLPDGDLHDWYFECGEDYKTVDWLATDHMGRNILHLVIIGLKVQSMDWLLQTLNVGICNGLKTTRNVRGYTPLQELYWRLEELRITDGELALPDRFQGFGEDAENCLSFLECLELPQPEDGLPRRGIAFYLYDFWDLLKDLGKKFRLDIPWSETKNHDSLQDHNHLEKVEYNAPVPVDQKHTVGAGSSKNTRAMLTLNYERVPSSTESAQRPFRIITRERLKYGCSCYMCLGGIISYRLEFAILIQATYLNKMLEQKEPTPHYHKFWNMMLAFWLGRVSRLSAQAYRESTLRHVKDARIFRAIARVVGEWHEFPSLEKIKDWLAQDLRNKNWLENPMRCDPDIRTALRVLFEFIKDQDEFAGTGTFGQSMAEYRDAIEKIIPCRNDREHGFVARMCGAPLDQPFNDFCLVE